MKEKDSDFKNGYKFRNTAHRHEPDYSRGIYDLPGDHMEKIFKRMCSIYGEDIAEFYMPELERVLKVFFAYKPEEMIAGDAGIDLENRFSEKDIILITYGDLLKGEERFPLETLANFCDTYLEGSINTIHILPFFPYSSDKGFSVIDFESVDPNLGTWDDIGDLEKRYQLMFDGVFNHISSKSRWFQEFLDGSPYYRDFFITFNSPDDLEPEDKEIIFRPRTTEILQKFDTVLGPKYVWATFSRDQLDLNFKNPNVLIRVIDILLMYVRHGADILRLDAVTYLWAEPGTRCVHLEQTHEIVKLFRDILNAVSPGVVLITETNVPHEENISYFGNGHDEAQMVYNFALPPLVLHTFYTEDATALSGWADTLKMPSRAATMFNFLDTHDGTGLMGAKNILTKDEINYIIERADANGGFVSYKATGDGGEEPYEINITWFSALNDDDSGEDLDYQVKRFTASRAIALVLQGVPGIYLHGLIGTENDIRSVVETNIKRNINRKAINMDIFKEALEDPDSKISLINKHLGRLIGLRTSRKAFHPNGGQKILIISKNIFSVLRRSPDESEVLLTLVNISNSIEEAGISLSDIKTDIIEWF